MESPAGALVSARPGTHSQYSRPGGTSAGIAATALPKFEGELFASPNIQAHMQEAMYRQYLNDERNRRFCAGLLCLALEMEWIDPKRCAQGIQSGFTMIQVLGEALEAWAEHLEALVQSIVPGADLSREAMRFCSLEGDDGVLDLVVGCDAWGVDNETTVWASAALSPHRNQVAAVLESLSRWSGCFHTIEDIMGNGWIDEELCLHDEVEGLPESERWEAIARYEKEIGLVSDDEPQQWFERMSELKAQAMRYREAVAAVCLEEFAKQTRPKEPWGQWAWDVAQVLQAPRKQEIQKPAEWVCEEQYLAVQHCIVLEPSAIADRCQAATLDQMLSTCECAVIRLRLTPGQRLAVLTETEMMAKTAAWFALGCFIERRFHAVDQ